MKTDIKEEALNCEKFRADMKNNTLYFSIIQKLMQGVIEDK